MDPFTKEPIEMVEETMLKELEDTHARHTVEISMISQRLDEMAANNSATMAANNLATARILSELKVAMDSFASFAQKHEEMVLLVTQLIKEKEIEYLPEGNSRFRPESNVSPLPYFSDIQETAEKIQMPEVADDLKLDVEQVPSKAMDVDVNSIEENLEGHDESENISVKDMCEEQDMAFDVNDEQVADQIYLVTDDSKIDHHSEVSLMEEADESAKEENDLIAENSDDKKDDIYCFDKKSGVGSKNGEQYGAEFKEVGMNLNMNYSLESLVAQIQGSNNTTGELTRLRNYLKQKEDLLRAESTRLAPLLAELDPSIHSLGYLFILEACTAAPISKEQANELVISVARFINLCAAEQIQLASDKFISVCKRFKDHVLLLEDPIRGVAPLLTAVRKLQVPTEHSTTLHADFLLLYLSSKCYKTGLTILRNDVYEVDHPRDLFLYCYYGGMICIGQKQFHKALELLHNVVTAPMTLLSAIAVEAFKKYILVSLIHLGQISISFPKYTSSAAQRNLKNLAQPYIELVNSYSTRNISEFGMKVDQNRVWDAGGKIRVQ